MTPRYRAATVRERSCPQARRPKAGPESGYAMLLVFLIAAMIAIALYNEMPRVAFEAQRTREQLLIERGEQYKRAIQLFVRKVNRYPASIEELESTNNFRFLRKRYVDPMTGKDKWRLIHINGGVLTDSIIPKTKPGQPGQDQQQPANTNTFIAEGPVMGATNDPNQPQINPALRRRQSDDRPVVTQEAPETPEPDASENTGDSDNNDNNDNSDETPAPGTPGAAAGIPGMPNQQTPGMPPGRFPQPGMYPPGAYPGQPGYNPAMANQPYGMTGGMPGTPNQMPGMGGANQSSSGGVYVAPSLGQPANVNTGSPTGYPGQPALPGQPGGFPGRPGGFPGRPGGIPNQPGGGFQNQAGPFPGQPQSNFPGQPAQPAATDPIANSLFGPSQIQPPGMGGTQIGGGIAGIASEYKGPAIKIYNERKKYNEWEFVYDQAKDRGLAGVQGNGGAPGTAASQMGNMPGQQPGGNGFGNSGGPGGNNSSNSNFSLSPGAGPPTPQQPQPQPQPQQPQN